MLNKITTALDDCILAIEQLKSHSAIQFIHQVSELIADCFKRGGKIILAGNGGSLCDAAHFAEELTGFFRLKRQPLPALVLSEPGHLSCVANDAGYEHVFARGVEAFGKPGDIFIGLTTSGNSPSIVKAFLQADQQGMHTVSFLGKGGGKLHGVADYELLISRFNTSDRIQEAHMAAIHIIIEQVENLLFYSPMVANQAILIQN